MTLGMLVTTDNCCDDIVGIAKAAAGRGHKVIIFLMDEGCRLVTDKRINALKDIKGVTMSLCDFNRKRMELADKDIPDGITCGSQYDNAVMNKEADKVIVF
jgi:predicted peroxiredoxin